MKTMIFSTSAITNKYDWLLKYKLWWDMIQTFSPIGTNGLYIDLYMINDGDLDDYTKSLVWDYGVRLHKDIIWAEQPKDRNVVYFPNRLGKLHFRGWCRSFFEAIRIAEVFSYDKVIHIESDAFVLSERLWKHLYGITEGWEVLWCPKYNFPENSIQVICKDSYEDLKQQAMLYKDGIRMGMVENLFPYKTVNKDFVGDRYGEMGLAVSDKMDYYCQYNDYKKQRG